jgi:hypothetical protein
MDTKIAWAMHGVHAFSTFHFNDVLLVVEDDVVCDECNRHVIVVMRI